MNDQPTPTPAADHPTPPEPSRRAASVVLSVTLLVATLPALVGAFMPSADDVAAVTLTRSPAAVRALAGEGIALPPTTLAVAPVDHVPETAIPPTSVPTTSVPATTAATTTTTQAPPPTVHTSVDFGNGLLAEVIAPRRAGPHPTLVFVHGGGWVKGSHLELPAELELDRLHERGWAVASIGYRLASRDAGVDAADQVADVARVLTWLRTDGDQLDLGGRIVGLGHSAGGHLLSLAAATMDPVIGPDTIIGVGGVYDFGPDIRENPLLRAVLPDALGCEPDECPEEWIESLMPATHAGETDPTVVLVHGTEDPVVVHRTAEDYAAALRSRGVAVELRLVEGAGHYDDALAGAVRDTLARVLDA